MGAFGMLGVSPLLPSLVEGFRLTRLDVAFVVPSVYVGGLLFSLPAGHLADRWGVRPTFLGGLALGSAGLALAAAAPRFGIFLACIFLAGVGWSVVNPVLGKAIVDLFPVRERGVAMGIKQMGLTVGGVIAALVLPPIAAILGWRAAVVACAVMMGAPVLASWRPLAPLAAARPSADGGSGAVGSGNWWWLGRPALLMLFGAGVALGMVQSAVLSYLPLYGVEVLGFTAIAAGVLVAAAQAGGAAAPPGPGAGVRGRRRRARLGGHLFHRERRGRRAAPVGPAQRRGFRGDRGGPAAGGAALRRGAAGARLLRGGVGGHRRALRAGGPAHGARGRRDPARVRTREGRRLIARLRPSCGCAGTQVGYNPLVSGQSREARPRNHKEETVPMLATPFRSAKELAAEIRRKKIGCPELLDLYLSRVEKHNPALNAIIATDVENARKRARAADRALARKQVWGPLHGVPMTIKESYHLIEIGRAHV